MRFLLLVLLPLALSAQGVQFEHTPWADVLAKAQKEHKPIFLDAYTVWCGPCKLLASKTFPDSGVGKFYNEKFVNAKMDMERGEGLQLAKKYGVNLYPTLLFIDGDGAVLHRVAGYYGVEEFLALGRQALDSERNLSGLQRKYASGDRSPEMLKAFMEAKSAAYDPETGKIAQEFLKTQTNLSTDSNMTIIINYVDDPYSEAFKYMVNHKKEFADHFSEPTVKSRLDQVFEYYLQTHETLQLGEIQRLYGTVYPEQGEKLASSFRLSYYRQHSDTEKFAQSALDHYSRFPTDDPDELNEMAYIFSQEVTNPDYLKKALEWSKKSVKLRETSYSQETLAVLYQKLGKTKQAQKAAARAVELAKSTGEPAPEAEKILKGV